MIGFGYDNHRLVEGESLILGGIKIESAIGTIAHSDGDALLHALCDALLGGAGLGDIGEHFPDTDPKYKDANSEKFVVDAMELIKAKNIEVENIDATILLETPKLKDYKLAIKRNIARMCDIHEDWVNIKAKTSEKMGFVGRSEGVVAYCVCQLRTRK
jgi:2-C-methyl-D-erythritol 2,4-cyclodiphosphate synthase